MKLLPFIPGHVYNRRSEINGLYGGNWQSGISVSASSPFIFIFTGKSGHQHGYKDGWDNANIFSYTGEGQVGDMAFTRGNLTLRDHLQLGKRVLLFEADGKGQATFIAELEFFDVDYFETHDSGGKTRTAIKFFFKRAGASIAIERSQLLPLTVSEHQPAFPASRPPNETERQGLVTSRVGQGAYRKRIIHRWEYQCAVTGFDHLQVLIASHILPWAAASDNERLDVHNGILLSPTYDALFDKHFISFEDSGKIILSDAIERQAFEKVGVTGKERIINLSVENSPYLEKHRATFQT